MEDASLVQIPCPWCEEYYSASVDTTQARVERVDKCPVCHRPIQITAECSEGEILSLEAARG